MICTKCGEQNTGQEYAAFCCTVGIQSRKENPAFSKAGAPAFALAGYKFKIL